MAWWHTKRKFLACCCCFSALFCQFLHDDGDSPPLCDFSTLTSHNCQVYAAWQFQRQQLFIAIDFGELWQWFTDKVVTSQSGLFGGWECKQAFERSSFLTVMAVMTGGTQLVKWAHLTCSDTRFCRESSKSRGFYDRGSENTIPCRK